ncbi:MAG: hypothetical protein ACOYJ8_02950 [Patescibacteria group bacterium]|jgi:hypothetical protein
MLKENGTLVALFVLVFLILGLFWWFDQQDQSLMSGLLTSSLSPTPKETINQEAIKIALVKNYNQPEGKLTIKVLEVKGSFARGTVKIASDDQVWLWLAYQDQSLQDWVLIHDGQGLADCQKLTEISFPVNFVGQCWDKDKGAVVDR